VIADKQPSQERITAALSFYVDLTSARIRKDIARQIRIFWRQNCGTVANRRHDLNIAVIDVANAEVAG
jgi:hypothetical protein